MKLTKAKAIMGITVGAVTLVAGAGAVVESRLDSAQENTRRYVDIKHDKVMVEVRNLRDGQHDIKSLLNKIDNRIYRMNRGNNGSSTNN